MKKLFITLLTLGFCLSLNAQSEHFINDNNYRLQVKKQFDKRQEIINNRKKELLSVFKKPITNEQKEALEFLYAYMPLSDLADYDGEFFLKQVNTALQAKDTFSWGKTIPEKIFRHFVLPFRVNNENLDTARIVFYNELKDRIKNLSMYDAALEVNHWCHEKVNYKASDIRTSAPLATIQTSWGRCGEESTFTVTAMRAVGIPARQVYTPRWAHTDDNHAWVEVFVDNKWQYLGACEPEPILNKGWFDKPVKRAMMVHTRVFGNYKDTTNNLVENPLYTKITTLENYTKTKKLVVKIIDEANHPIDNAEVRFGIYNYSEFYPMVEKHSDKNGETSITTGLGDLMISASKGKLYGEAKATGTSVDTVYITLKNMLFTAKRDTLFINPPVALEVEEVDSSKKAENDRRLEQEDSIRNAYQATFMTAEEARKLAISLNLDTAKVSDFIKKSHGNWKEIASYLEKNAKDSRVLDLLSVIAEKDIRDTPETTLTAHLKATKPNTSYPTEIYNEGILNMRLQNELLRPWKPYLQAKFSEEFKTKVQNDITTIINWIGENITLLDNEENYAHCPISPIGTYDLKYTDEQGRNLFFVALCRSLDIPARINTATYQPQYYKEGKWLNISFKPAEKIANATAKLILKSNSENFVKPEYYIHFTIQHFKDGAFKTLDYEYSTIFNEFPTELQLVPGYYCLMTGHRDDNGNISVLREYFNLEEGLNTEKTITLLPLEKKETVLGSINTDLSFIDMKQETHYVASIINEKGAVFAILEPSREPTRHIMVDIPLLKKELDKAEVPFVFIISKDKLTSDFSIENYKGLPERSYFFIDNDNMLTDNLLSAVKLTKNSFYPIVMFVNNKGQITFLSTGYRIGIGESLLKQMQ